MTNPTIVQQAQTLWVSNQVTYTINAVFGETPTPGNLLVAIYGGMIDNVANYVAGTMTQKQWQAQANASSTNPCGLGIATRVVQAGDGETWGFIMAVPADGTGRGVGMVIFEIENAGTVTTAVASGASGGSPVAAQVSIASTLNSLLIGAGTLFSAAAATVTWTFTSGWTPVETTLNNATYPGAIGAASFTGTGSSVTSLNEAAPINTGNEEWVAVVIDIAALPSFTVTFNNNGGTGSLTAQTNNVAAALSLFSTGTMANAGYTFMGWNTAANGSGTAYADGASYPFTASATLYAQWTVNSVTGAAPTAGWLYVLNTLAGTKNLGELGAANAYAGTTGLGLLAALNVKAGTKNLGLDAVCNSIAGTTGMSALGALCTKAGL
jgi:hypothetical protein